MTGITWSRDSHGLFDYECRQLKKINLRAQQPSVLIRGREDLQLHSLRNDEPLDKLPALVEDPENVPLLKITNQGNCFYVESCADEVTVEGEREREGE